MNIKKVMKKWIVIAIAALMLAVGIIVCHTDRAYAADSVSVKVTSGTVKIGDTATVTVTLNSNSEMGAQRIYVSYDPQVLELVTGGDISGGGGSAQWIGTDTKKSVSFTLQFKTLKVGKSNISINTESSEISDMNEERMSIKASSGSVTVSAPISYSSDNTLKSLSISPGALTPAFASGIYDYKVSLDENQTRLTVSAVANHSKAKVSITGNNDLKPGSNKVTIMVTAENGNKRNYTITVNKPVPETQTPEPTVNKTASIDGINYEIIEDFSARALPENFAATECDYNGQKVMAGKHAGNGIIIMYLQAVDDKGKSGFYVYDTVNKTFSPYIVLGESKISYVMLPISDNMEKPDGYKIADVTVNDNVVKVLKNGNDDFYLFYGMNSEGSTGWYSYDIKENTVQRYVSASPVDNNGETQASNESSSDKIVSGAGIWKVLAVIMTVITIAMVVITVSVMTKNKKLLADSAKVSDKFEDLTANGSTAGDNTSQNKNTAKSKQQSDEAVGGNDDEFEDKDVLLDDDDVLEVSEISEVADNAESSKVSESDKSIGLSEVSSAENIELSEVSEPKKNTEFSGISEAIDTTEGVQELSEEISLEEVSDLEASGEPSQESEETEEVEVIEFDDVKK